MLIATEQEAAHAGFQINREFHRFVGVIDDAIGVLHPLDHRQQISNQGYKEHGAERANAQRQSDVARQEFAKPCFINRRRSGHGAALSNCRNPGVCPKTVVWIHFSDCFGSNFLHFPALTEHQPLSLRREEQLIFFPLNRELVAMRHLLMQEPGIFDRSPFRFPFLRAPICPPQRPPSL